MDFTKAPQPTAPLVRHGLIHLSGPTLNFPDLEPIEAAYLKASGKEFGKDADIRILLDVVVRLGWTVQHAAEDYLLLRAD